MKFSEFLLNENLNEGIFGSKFAEVKKIDFGINYERAFIEKSRMYERFKNELWGREHALSNIFKTIRTADIGGGLKEEQLKTFNKILMEGINKDKKFLTPEMKKFLEKNNLKVDEKVCAEVVDGDFDKTFRHYLTKLETFHCNLGGMLYSNFKGDYPFAFELDTIEKSYDDFFREINYKIQLKIIDEKRPVQARKTLLPFRPYFIQKISYYMRSDGTSGQEFNTDMRGFKGVGNAILKHLEENYK